MESNYNNPTNHGNDSDVIEYVNLTAKRRTSFGAMRYCATVTLREHSSSIYFVGQIAEIAAAKGAQSMRIARNKLTGELFFVFVADPSYIKTSYSHNKSGNICGLQCTSRRAIQWLLAVYEVTGGRMTLELSEDLSKVADVATFKILKVVAEEEG